jgi:ribulose-5-phosphate 4-epimerase/fuculose-1-phosphate aldolase
MREIEEVIMAVEHGTIAWKHDLDEALNLARQQQRHVLLDFSAAPM